MFRFDQMGRRLQPLMDADTGGTGGAAAAAPTESGAETSAQPAAAPESAPAGEAASADPHKVTREDFLKNSKFLRSYQETKKQESEKIAPGTGTTPPAGQVPTEPIVADEKKIAGSEQPVAKPEAGAETVPEKIKMPDGKEYTLAEIAEFEKGYMRQADYTKKTQQLAEERKKALNPEFDVEQAKEALQLKTKIERDPVGTLSQMLEEYAEKGIIDPKDEVTLEIEDRIRAVEAENSQLKGAAAEKERIEIQNLITSQLDQLAIEAKKDGLEFDHEAVLAEMIKTGIYDPVQIWKSKSYDSLSEKAAKQAQDFNAQLKAAKEAAVNDYVKSKQSKGSAPTPIGSTTAGSPVIKVEKTGSMKDARKAALARMSNT